MIRMIGSLFFIFAAGEKRVVYVVSGGTFVKSNYRDNLMPLT